MMIGMQRREEAKIVRSEKKGISGKGRVNSSPVFLLL
jgi:hypothetical protein